VAIPASSRWWIGTLLVLVLLLGLSALALDRPNVVWFRGEPQCPSCRKVVERYSHQCAACRSEFDWTVSPAENSPLSAWSLSPVEFEHLGALRAALGREEAARRVAARFGIPDEAAARWLTAAAPGRCGFCGGTGSDLGAAPEASASSCPVCFGSGACIACGGDRHVRLGDWGAARALEGYEREAADLLQSHVPAAARRERLRALTEEFLRLHAGSEEAGRLPHWVEAAERAERGASWVSAARAVEIARGRIDAALEALEEPAPDR
jgi:hypothetical protein